MFLQIKQEMEMEVLETQRCSHLHIGGFPTHPLCTFNFWMTLVFKSPAPLNS
jgi:hypothetical protein